MGHYGGLAGTTGQYLREIATVPLLTREGEGEIARRIERGKLAVIKSISRTPLIVRKVIALGDQLHSGDRTIREIVRFNRAEIITDERIQERSTQVQEQIDAVREARAVSEKLDEKLRNTPKGATTKDKRHIAARGGPRCGRASNSRTAFARLSSPKPSSAG